MLRDNHTHVAEYAAELQHRRDLIRAIDLPFIRRARTWSLLPDAAIAATPTTGWGADAAARHVISSTAPSRPAG